MRTLAILVAGFLAAGVAGAATPAAAQAVWQGYFFVTALTPPCGPDEPPVGSFLLAVYRPNIAPPPPGQAKETLSLFGTNYAVYYASTTDTLRGVNRVEGTLIRENADYEPIDEDLGLTISPDVITAKTRRVKIDGILQHFLNNHACDVFVKGVLGLRPAG
jgi:hypothetical protein